MKKMILMIIVFAGLSTLQAQTIQNKPKPTVDLQISSGSFCTVVDGRLVTLTLDADSVFFEDQIADRHYKQAFLVLQQKQQDDFLLFNIVLPNKATAKIKTSYREGLYVIKLPKQNNQDSISICHDKTVIDLTGALSLSAIDNLKRHFFETWYPETHFKSFASFRDCRYASKEELQLMGDTWVSKFNIDKSKISANTGWQAAAAQITQNIWTSVLIKFHFNPVVNFPVLHGYFMNNQIPMPLLVDYDGPAIYIDRAFAQPQQIIINAPRGNNY